MNIAQMKEAAEGCIAADQPLMLWGAPGCGKSQGLAQLAEKMGYNYLDIRLSQMDAVDLRGIPFRDNKTNKTDWATPKIWPSEDDKKPTLVSFDEINHAIPSTLTAAFQAIQERRIGDYYFPENTRFIAAGNRASDGTVANHMPSALRNRFSHLTIESELNDWIDWATKKGIDPIITGYIRYQPQALNELQATSETAEEQDRVAEAKRANAFATPRSWEAVDKLLKADMDTETFSQLVVGTVGEQQACSFNGYREYYKDLPPLEEILKTPTKFSAPAEPALMYAICAGLAAIVTDQTIDNLVKYLGVLEPEFQAMCMADSVARNPLLSITPGFATWAANNQEVLL